MENIEFVRRNDGAEGVRTAFVFSCPGQEEEKSGLLVNGQTGRNLDMLLHFLHQKRPDLFPSEDRYYYRITNSSERIHYKARDGRTEPSSAEIKAPDNLERLTGDIKDYDVVITFGRGATEAVSLLADKLDNKKILHSRHLSFLSLNSGVKNDINGEPIPRGDPDSTKKRLEAVAADIISQI